MGSVVLSPDDIIGDRQTVRDALLKKHPESGFPLTALFQDYQFMPLFFPVTIPADHIEHITKKLRGSAGLGLGSMRTTFPNFNCGTKKPVQVYAM